ncbi:nitroreductase family protein [Peribacillus saganii]|uniref:Nitroreductase family protein n=1 Tax=Peribacillus saganii TaxID=2303992 RepID=A0A372L9N5_9BACI|nr:nitroreductase family protein [Peribacillus saganii]RFU61958.1 nitroreductase family protein [Peribacillus saganii]
MTKNIETTSVQQAIESRRSIRKYAQQPIDREDLQHIFELVRLSPSAWNLQPWRFHVVINEDLKQKLEDAAYGQKQVTSAPAVIVVTSDMEDVLANLTETVHPGLPEERKEEEVATLSAFFNGMSVEDRGQWGLTQTNIAFGFLMIAVQGMGYASNPMLGFDQDKVRELLGLPAHVKFAGILPIGKPNSEGHPHHRFDLNKIVAFH